MSQTMTSTMIPATCGSAQALPESAHGDSNVACEAAPAIKSIADLIEQTCGPVRIACDTEFEGLHTLSIQFATRVGRDLIVQVYHSPAIPSPPAGFDLDDFLPDSVRQRFDRVVLRPVKKIERRLSPVRALADLLDLRGLQPMAKQNGDPLKNRNQLSDPVLLLLIGHFWPADFFRVFGERFYASLVQSQVSVQSRKLLKYRDQAPGANRYHDPILEYVRDGYTVHPVKVRTFDTFLAFGPASLDAHARTFLGVSKSSDITKEEKGHMRDTFGRRPREAYGYALLDAVLTLLVEERMREEDRKMYGALGLEASKVPPLQATLGSRVSEMLTKAIANDTAVGSVLLSAKGTALKNGGVGAVSLCRVKNLLEKGSRDHITSENLSKFGKQTGDTHGGLLFSRSPTKLFHEGPGQFRDVDLSGCYASIIGGMNLYLGRPLIHEPGPGKVRLKDAIAFVREHAAGNDAWIIKVSGPLTRMPNVLVPSTNEALTHANYQSQAARKRASARRSGFVFDQLDEARKKPGNATLFTDVIEAGVVAWPTWLIIQALPEAMRQEHEDLEVETILFYPEKMVARTGPEYDALVENYAQAVAPWTETIDLGRMERTIIERVDSDYVGLRFPLGELVKKVSQFRKEAKEKHGKGSGAELAWKVHANSTYGVLASPYLMTNNVVCANIITATARALAYAMQMSLNGFQVITDGCTYRRDQVPAGTFSECLNLSGEYPIRRVENGLAFVLADTIPDDDKQFTSWYRQHVQRFFGVSGPDYDQLFGIHELEHKQCGEPAQAAFDGLCCDGSANYLKLMHHDKEWKIVDFKARSYKKEEKDLLGPWIVKTYREDDYQGPPPITESTSLLSYKDAGRIGRKALEALEEARTPQEREEAPVLVAFPLGLAQTKVQAYKIFKPSTFLYRTPAQRAKTIKAMQKFSEAHACGLEVLSLRRSQGARRKGSLVDIAEDIYQYVRSGRDNLTRELNLTRSFKELDSVQKSHFQVIQGRKHAARLKLYRDINSHNLDEDASLTGLYVQKRDIIQLG
jgi:hypothetical protein